MISIVAEAVGVLILCAELQRSAKQVQDVPCIPVFATLSRAIHVLALEPAMLHVRTYEETPVVYYMVQIYYTCTQRKSPALTKIS